jgi:hypothetical protein
MTDPFDDIRNHNKAKKRYEEEKALAEQEKHERIQSLNAKFIDAIESMYQINEMLNEFGLACWGEGKYKLISLQIQSVTNIFGETVGYAIASIHPTEHGHSYVIEFHQDVHGNLTLILIRKVEPKGNGWESFEYYRLSADANRESIKKALTNTYYGRPQGTIPII